MLALEKLIAQRLRELPALTGWAVRTGTDDADRRPVPAVDVRMGGAEVPKAGQRAVQLQPHWQVSLVVARSDDAAATLDAAIEAVIAALHNWRPAQDGRQWSELYLQRVLPVDFSESGLVGFELTFTTSSLFHGQP